MKLQFDRRAWIHFLYLIFPPATITTYFLLNDFWWADDFNLFSDPSLHCIIVGCRLNKTYWQK